MALPTKSEIGGLEYSHLGLPFFEAPAKDLAETGGLEFSFLGLPFVTNPIGTSTPEPPTYNTAQFMIMF